jgi:hypothetical protein
MAHSMEKQPLPPKESESFRKWLCQVKSKGLGQVPLLSEPQFPHLQVQAAVATWLVLGL